jgi:hypothetical protein
MVLEGKDTDYKLMSCKEGGKGRKNYGKRDIRLKVYQVEMLKV